MTGNKITSLLDFLAELTRINSKITHDLNEYRKVLWISDIPSDEPKHCFTRVWGITEEQGDSWVEVKKFSEPQVPIIPEVCRPWVNLKNIKKIEEIPVLENSITVEEKKGSGDQEEKYFKTLKLINFPDVERAWKKYIDSEWKAWVEIYKRYQRVQKVYSDLFFIYQELQKSGEQFELVFSFGLLTWKSPLGNIVKRHLITAKCSLEFEAHQGLFTLGPSNEGDQADVEFDMLDLEIQPSNAKSIIEKGRKTLRENLWDRASLDALLFTISNSLSGDGEGEYFKDNLAPSNQSSSKKPMVEFAPALILRKRSNKGLEWLLTKIKEKMLTGILAPKEFLDLCESLGESREEVLFDDFESPFDSDTNASTSENGINEIYFPLSANDEQRQIIHAINRQSGVLVQGPPGTGKSHTIANLICHLLATGKRVLVTSKTGRALQVLSDKLPSEIRPLCISLLGSGVEERKSLEKSVDGILRKLDKRTKAADEKKVKLLRQNLFENRKLKAEIDKKLLYLREKETFSHNVGKNKYKGTAAQIAREVKNGEEKYSWLLDEVQLEMEYPFTKEETELLIDTLKKYDKETERILSLTTVDLESEFPNLVNVNEMFEKENELSELLKSYKEVSDTAKIKSLLQVDKSVLDQLKKEIDEFLEKCEQIRKKSFSWTSGSVFDVLSGKEKFWKELFKVTTQKLAEFNDLVQKVENYDVQIPNDLKLGELLQNANLIKNHLDQGGKLGFWIFKPKVVKIHGAFIETVRLNGRICNNQNVLEELVNYLKVKNGLEFIWGLWMGKANPQNDNFNLQLSEVQNLLGCLENILGLLETQELIKRIFNKVKILKTPNWENEDSFRDCSKLLQFVLLKINLSEVKVTIGLIENRLENLDAQGTAHPVIKQILNSLRDRNEREIKTGLFNLRDVLTKSQQIKIKKQILDKASVAAPNLVKQFSESMNAELWIERLTDIQAAWDWARAKTWVNSFFSLDSESLERQRNQSVEEIQKIIESLASYLAWGFCFERMGEDQRRHLIAWEQAMKKLGKGTGKYANTHRQEAQRHLNECRVAVPAWIMPLHKVYETVEGEAGIFDVIIVDEASQCGPEGLPLFYLGKRVIVVGDDKQISPEAVGVNRQQIQKLMSDYLSDFQHSDSFDIEKSLFDHARIRFPNKINLREHFRCMPEIITFSNDLCYQSDPLIPLRQFPPDRLDPIKTKYVENGFREGDGQKVINRPEAEELVAQVIKCCDDERYEGMTMGVIALQGDSQADLIERMLLEKLGAEEMENRKLICGNPYTFQGDERDVVFLSMVAAPNERIGALTKATDQRRFNVAASRAQDQVWLFYSATLNDLSEQCFRRKLLSYYLEPKSPIENGLGFKIDDLRKIAFKANRNIEKAPKPFDSWFEVDTALEIAGRGYRVVPQFHFADKRIDLVVQGLETQIAVECDGDFWHGQDEYIADMERQRKLERCGWQFVRLRESGFYASKDKTLEGLWETLKDRGIYPIVDEQSKKDNKSNSVPTIETEDEQEEKVEIEEDPEEVEESDDDSKDESPELGLGFKSSVSGIPTSIDEAMQVESEVICSEMVRILNQRTNNSCIRSNMPTYLLKRWSVQMRSKRRKMFSKIVNNQIARMIRKGYLIKYTSVNDRIKLGWKKYSLK